MDLLKNEFEFWKQKWSNEDNDLPKNALDTLSKCPEDLFPHINILLILLLLFCLYPRHWLKEVFLF